MTRIQILSAHARPREIVEVIGDTDDETFSAMKRIVVMRYRQITSGERYMLAALRKQGSSAAAIARQLGRHPSTIAREIRRNQCNDGAYRPSKAERRTRGRRPAVAVAP